jgi:hypothetical protein
MLEKFISLEDSGETSEMREEQNKIEENNSEIEDECDIDDLGISAAVIGLMSVKSRSE